MQPLALPFPTPMMLQMKFDFYLLAGLGDIHVWKCEQTEGRTDEWTDAGLNPIL